MVQPDPDERSLRGPAEEAFGSAVRRPERLSDQVAAAMLETILRRGMRPGEQLPTERELGEQFGVSRTVVREAVRALIARGVVHARPGRGLTVAAVGPDAVSSSISLYLHGRDQLPYEQVHEVRQLLEIQIAGLAAEHGTGREAAQLWEQCEQSELLDPDVDVDVQVAADIEFHRQLARMTHNELYLILLDSLAAIMYEVRRGTHGRVNVTAGAFDMHRVIAERVLGRDAEGARDAMRRHLEDKMTDWRTLGEPVDLTRVRRAASAR